MEEDVDLSSDRLLMMMTYVNCLSNHLPEHKISTSYFRFHLRGSRRQHMGIQWFVVRGVWVYTQRGNIHIYLHAYIRNYLQCSNRSTAYFQKDPGGKNSFLRY